MDNEEITRLLRCSEDELRLLSIALRQQMEETHINGKPLLGRLAPCEFANSRKLQEEMCEGVAESDPVLRAMLSGARWEAERPKHFERELRRAKSELMKRLNATFRYKAKYGPTTRTTASERSTSSGSTPTPKDKRRSQLTRGRPYPVPLKPTSIDDRDGDRDGPRDGPAMRGGSHSGESVICLGSKRRLRSVDSRETSEGHDLTHEMTMMTKSDSDPFVDRAPADSGIHVNLAAPPEYVHSHRPEPSDYHGLNPGVDASFVWSRYSIPPHLPQQPAHQYIRDRYSLSARIQEAVNHNVAVIEARVTDLEEERNQRDAGLERRIMGFVGGLLAERDELIRNLRAELEDERSWRDS